MFTKFLAICTLVAAANAGAILERNIASVPIAKTSINGPSGSIIEEKSLPVVTEEHKTLIETPVAIEGKTIVHSDSVEVEAPVVAKTLELPITETRTFVHHESPVVEAKTLVHQPIVEAKTLVHNPYVETKTYVEHPVAEVKSVVSPFVETRHVVQPVVAKSVVHHEVPVITKSLVHEVPVVTKSLIHHESPLVASVNTPLVKTLVHHDNSVLLKTSVPTVSYYPRYSILGDYYNDGLYRYI